MVKEGIVLGHKISKNGIEVDKAKVDVIAKLPHPTTVKGVRSFLSHAGFYRRFIKDFSKISRPMTHLLEKNTLASSSPMKCIKLLKNIKEKNLRSSPLDSPCQDIPLKRSAFKRLCHKDDALWGLRNRIQNTHQAVPHTSSFTERMPSIDRAQHMKRLLGLEACKNIENLETAGDQRKVQLKELNELVIMPKENSLIYKRERNKEEP
ncbi:hypothetical protein Tco_0392812 [Tanacetum coccineum]